MLRRRRRRLTVAGASLVVVALVGAATLVRSSEQGLDTIGPAPSGAGTTAPAPISAADPTAAVLRLAEIAEEQPPLTSAGREIIHQRHVTRVADPSVSEEHWYEEWDLGNGRRRLRADTAGTVSPWGAADGEWRFVPAGAVAEAKQPPIERAPTSFSATAASIPGTGGALPDQRAAFRVMEGIATANVDSQIRAGWLRLLAQVPGLQLTDDVDGPTGRRGVEIRVAYPRPDGGSVERAIIVDPASATVLSSQVVERPPATGGVAATPSTEITYVVDATDTAPPADVVFS